MAKSLKFGDAIVVEAYEVVKAKLVKSRRAVFTGPRRIAEADIQGQEWKDAFPVVLVKDSCSRTTVPGICTFNVRGQCTNWQDAMKMLNF